MRCTSTGLVVALAGLLAASTAQAATIIPPRDLAELADSSAAVVLARAGVARGELRAGIPFTVTEFELLEAIAGTAPPETFEVMEPGGDADGVIAVVPGSPRYALGADYLLFLAHQGDRFRTKLLSWGVFERRIEAAGVRFVPVREVRDLASIGRTPVEPLRPLDEAELRERLGRALRPGALRGAPVGGGDAITAGVGDGGNEATAACRYLENTDGVPARWFRFADGASATVLAANPDGVADEDVVRAAAAAWNGHSGSDIQIEYAGAVAKATCTGGYQAGAVLFGDPCGFLDDLQECTGVIAWGGPLYNGEVLEFGGERWHDAYDLFVVVNQGARCIGDEQYAEVVTHELGHGLGFGHHEDPDAVMYYACCRGIGADLAATDRVCATATYPAANVQPEPPTEVAATAVAQTAVRVTWRAAGDEDGFLIERNLGGGWAELARTGGDATSHTDGDVPACAGVAYRLRALAGGNASDPSPAASVTTPGSAPPAPTAVTAVLHPGGVEVVWQQAAVGATSVTVERARPGVPFAVQAVLDGTATSYRDDGGDPRAQYRVSSSNSCGTSPAVTASVARAPTVVLQSTP